MQSTTTTTGTAVKYVAIFHGPNQQTQGLVFRASDVTLQDAEREAKEQEAEFKAQGYYYWGTYTPERLVEAWPGCAHRYLH